MPAAEIARLSALRLLVFAINTCYGDVVDVAQKPSLRIEKEGPEYWKALCEKLAEAIDTLPADFSGGVNSFEGGFRITIHRLGKAFSQNHTDLFYSRGSGEIRCATLRSGPYSLKFSMTRDNKLAVISTRASAAGQMSPEQASQHIVQLMLK